MAEKTVKILECDRFGCRRRKDVVGMEVFISVNSGLAEDLTFAGDLCPYHREQLIAKTEAMFDNRKDQTAH